MKKKLTILLVFIFIITFSVNVFAKEKVDLNVDKSNVNSGDEITVSINFSKESEIAYAYTAKLSYDENIFGSIDKDNFEEQENWSDINYNAKNKKFALINKSGESGKKLVQIKLKVKEGAKQGKTTISVGNVTSTNGESDILIDGNSVEVQVGDDSNDTTSEEIENIDNEKISTETGKSSFKYMSLIPIALGVLVIAFLIYLNKKNKNLDKNRKTLIFLIGGVILLALVIITISIMKSESPDINDDGIINYEDANKIVDYLLEIENPEEQNEDENAGTDNSQLDASLDGEVSAEDVGRVLRSAKNNTRYSAKVSENASSSNNGVSNNSGNGNGSNGGPNQNGDPGNQGGNQGGQGQQPGGNQGGENPPKPDDNYSTNIENGSNTYNYTPKQGEDVFLDLEIEITPAANVKEVIIDGKTYPVEKGEGNNYTVKVPAPNKPGKYDIVIEGVVLENGRRVKAHYIVTIDVLKKVPNILGIEVDAEKQPPELKVDISDKDDAITDGKVVITDIAGNKVFEKDLTKEELLNGFKVENLERNQRYIVIVDANYDLDSNQFGDLPQNSGSTTHRQEIKIKENIKRVPTAIVEVDIRRQPTEEGVKSIKASIQIIDKDNTIKDGTLKAVLKDPEGKQVGKEIKLTGKEKSIEFTSDEAYKAGTYTIEIIADYDIGDEDVYRNKTIGTALVPSLIYASIENAEVEKAEEKFYLQKEQEFEITYTIKSNTQEKPNSIVINTNTYQLNPVDGETGKYKVSLKAPEKAGVVEYNAQRLIYENEQVACTNTTKVDVLKNIKPEINALAFETNNNEAPLLSFEIDDPEDTFVSGKVKLTAEGKEPIEINIDSKENTTFKLDEIEKTVKYKVEIEVTYDFDSNKEDEKHKYTEILKAKDIEWVSDYELTISEYKLDHIDINEKKIYVTFNSTNTSNQYTVQTVVINKKDYEAKSQGGNSYIVEIPYDNTERKELELQEVILNNSQGFKKDNYFASIENVVVFKIKPTATAKSEVSEDNKSITTQVAIKDEEKIAEDLKMRLAKEDGTEIEVKPLEDNNELTFEAPNDGEFEAGKYKKEILATFDAVDGKEKYVDEVIGESEAQVDVKVEVKKAEIKTDSGSNYYVNRNSNVNIIYEIDSNTTMTIQELVVNGERLPAKNIDGNNYQVTVTTPNNYGIASFNLTQIIYDEENKVDVTGITTTVDVLRNVEPTVEEVIVNDETDKPTLTFNVVDPEDTFISGKIIVKKAVENGEQTQEPIIFNKKDNLSFELGNIENSTEYNVEIFLTYDLDSNKAETEEGKENRTTDKPVINKQFSIITDYNFNLSDYKVKSVNRDTQTVTLEFKSTLNENTNCYIDTVKISGKIYKGVIKAENTYTVEIPYNGEERQEFILEEVILNNLHGFQIEENNKAVIFKKVTSAIIPSVSDDLMQINVTINMLDEDGIAENIRLVLYDNNNTQKESKSITKETKHETFNLENQMEGNYTIKILADFDAEDGNGKQENVEVSSAEVKVPATAIIDNAVVPPYVEKNKEFEVTYTIRKNTQAEIETVVVNGAPCPATKQQEDNLYTVKVNPFDEAGEKEVIATAVNFAGNESAEVYYTSTTEVLKSEKPSIANLKVDDSEGKVILSYEIVDPEDTFVSGTIKITDTESNETQQIEMLSQEEATYTHELTGIKQFTKYNIVFEIKYDLDKDKTSAEHQYTETITENHFELIGDYDFKLENFKVEKVNTEPKQIELSFTSSNASEDMDEHEDYYVQEVVVNDQTYPVEKVKDQKVGEMQKYTFSIPYEDETRKDLNLQKAKLNNYKEFENLEKHVVVFKTKPTANIETEVNDEQTEIKAKPSIVDTDSTIVDLEIRLIDPKEGLPILTEAIKSDSNEVNFTSPEAPKMFTAGKYQVELYAKLDLVDGKVHEEKEKIGIGEAHIATKAKITEAQVVSYFVEKNSNVQVNYKFESNNDSLPKGLNIENVYYELAPQEDGTCLLSLPVDGNSSFGEKTIKATVAIYGEGGEETTILEETKEVNYYVLKENPSIEYTFNEHVKDQTLEFKLKNPDNAAIENAEVVLTEEATGKEILRKQLNTQINEETNSADTTIELKDLESGTYNLALSGKFDKDDKDEETSNIHDLSEIFENRTINITTNYTANISISKVEVNNEEVTVTFTSGNSANLNVEKIVVAGQEIEVTKNSDGTYTAVIPCESEGKQTIKIDEVVVEYGIHISLTENNTFVIYKEKPTADISAEKQADNLLVKYTIHDNDKVSKNEKVVVTKGDKKYEQQITDKPSGEITFEEITEAGDYKIQILAEFDCVDGKASTEPVVIGEITYNVPITATINYVGEEQYPEKNQPVTLKYSITTNTTEKVTALVFDELEEIPATPLDSDEYTVTINAPGTAGEKTYKVNEVIIGDQHIQPATNEQTKQAKIDVLKDKPSIINYNLNKEAKQITFDLLNPDNAEIDGNIVIKSENDNQTVQTVKLQTNTNTIDLSGCDDSQSYVLTLEGTYNLDSTPEDEKNKHQLAELFRQEFQLNISTKLEIESVSKDYPERNEVITITFNVKETNTSIPISAIIVGETECPANFVAPDKYTIEYKAKDSAGVEELIINAIKYQDTTVQLAEKISTKIDILKNKPTVEINEITQNYDQQTVTFKFTVKDEEKAIQEQENALKASATFGTFKNEGGTEQAPVILGENTITFKEVTPNTPYEFKITADLDLDSDGSNGKNQQLNETLLTTNASLIDSNSLNVTDIQAQSTKTNAKSKYIEKNEQFKLNFAVQLTGEYTPVAAYIGDNDTYYELEQSEGTYTTKETLQGKGEAGEQEIKINKLKLNNDQIVEVNATGNVEVLKSKLTLKTFEISQKDGKAKAQVEFEDADNSFVSGKLVITDTNTENPEQEREVPISKEKTEFDLDVTPFKKYKVALLVSYDLDSNQTVNSENYVADDDKFAEVKELELIADYGLKVSDLKVLSVNKESNTAKLQFKAENNSSHKVSFVKVADKDSYAGVGEEDTPNTYTFDYQIEKQERTEIKLGSVKLDNGTELDVSSQEVKTLIFKTHPKAEISKVEVQENNKIYTEFSVTDDDSTLKNLYISVKKDGEESDTQETSIENISDRTATIEVEDPGTYKVVLKATYEAIDGELHEKEVLDESDNTVEIVPIVSITDGKVSNKYPEKGKDITITYKIATNVLSKPTKLTLSTATEAKEYPITEVEGTEGEYQLTYIAPDQKGIQDIEVTTVWFGDDISVPVEAKTEDGTSLQIDVLRDIPKIQVSSVDMLEIETVSFKISIEDPDNAFISGTANVGDTNKELQTGLTTMNVQIPVDSVHTFNATVHYDRDSDHENDLNTGTVSEQQQFTLVGNYNLKISNLRAVQRDTDTPVTTINKNTPLRLKFNLTTDATLEPKKIYLVDEKNESLDEVMYDVHKAVEGENEYYIDFVSKDAPGKQTFKITGVQLSSSKVIKEDKFAENNSRAEITVLRDAPTMSNYQFTNNGDNITTSFTIKDEDSALEPENKIKLVDQEDENNIIDSQNLEVGSNNCTFENLEENKKYFMIIENKHKLSEDGELVEDEFKRESIEILNKADFKAKHVEITKRVKEGQQVEVSFENAVLSPKDVNAVTIDGIEKSVEKGKDGVYKVQLEPQNKGVNTINLQNAKIGDQEFNISRTLEYTYEFVDPIADDVSEIQQVGTNAQVTYKLIDTDNSVKSMKAYMKTTSGAVIATKDLKQTTPEKPGDYEVNPEVTNTVEMPLMKITNYQIELTAMCDIGNGKIEEKSLFTKKIEADPKVTIASNSVITDEYSEKGAQVILQYKIVTNVDKEVSRIYIDDVAYSVEKVLDDKKNVIPDTYNVKVYAPKKSGVYPQKVTKMQIGTILIDLPKDGQESDGGLYYDEGVEPAEIKVLKDKPTVSHFIIDEKSPKQTVSFRVNDPDKSLSHREPSKLNIKLKEGEPTPETTEIPYGKIQWNDREGYGEYDAELDKIGLKETGKDYNVTLDATYDRRPDAAEETDITYQLREFFKNLKEFFGKKDEQEESEKLHWTEWIVTDQVYEDTCSLTGDINYNMHFQDLLYYYGYLLPSNDTFNAQFYCSTGTEHKVEKAIINGKEWKISKCEKEESDVAEDEFTYMYTIEYTPDSVEQTSLTYDALILDNGTAVDLKDYSDIPTEYYSNILVYVQPADPTFTITGFSEDDTTRKVRFSYNVTDIDGTVVGDLKFTLKDSQNKVRGEVTASPKETFVEFNIPDPPTSVYHLTVLGERRLMLGELFDEFTDEFGPFDFEQQSSITTSILDNDIKNKYPKRNETIELIYNISSTKVILIDKDDHSNQDKAVGISSLVINDQEYSVEMLDQEVAANKDKYRVYYTAGDQIGLQDLKVSSIKFTNGEEEHFERTDQIEIIKDEPKVTEFSMENKLDEDKVKFKLKVEDPDNVIVNDEEDLYAEVNGNKQYIKPGETKEIEFIAPRDELSKIEVKGTYELSTNKLEEEKEVHKYENHTFFENPFVLTGDYGIDFDSIKLYNSQDKETTYFEKGEDVKVVYDMKTKYKGIYPKTITIDGKEYTPEEMLVTEEIPVEEQGEDEATERTKTLYTVTLKADEKAGKNEFKIEKALLNSENEIKFAEKTIPYEVLKSPITVEDFKFNLDDNTNDVKVSYTIKDDDEASSKYSVEVKDEYGYPIKIEHIPDRGNNEFSFGRTARAEKYFVAISADYDRDSDSGNLENNANNEQIDYEIITVNNRYIEMKDILDIELYKHGIGKTERVPSITPQVLKEEPIENFLVKVKMKDMPEFYSKLLSFKEENGKLTLYMEYQDAMVFTKGTGEEGKLTKLEVTLDIPEGAGDQDYQYGGSFESLVARMKEDPNATIVLDKDYDLADYPNTNDNTKKAIIDFEFKGTIDGNGHSITNLRKPLFEKLNGATIKNLTFRKVHMIGSEHKGSVAKEAISSNIENVHIDEIILESGNGQQSQNTAGIVYEAKDHTNIKQCSVTKVDYRTTYLSSYDAGIACIIDNGSKIENCLVNGKMGSMRCYCAGIVVQAKNNKNVCEINNCIVKLPMNAYYEVYNEWGGGNGGITANASKVKLTNVLSLVVGNSGTAPIYNPNTKFDPISEDSTNVYQLESAPLKHAEERGIKSITEDDIDANFYKETLKLDEAYWTIPDDASSEKLPSVKGLRASYNDGGAQPENTDLYIPDYNRVTNMESYDKENEIIYHNMYKLMPFYDTSALINDGNKISETHQDSPLCKQLIKYIIPYNKEGKAVTYLSTDDYNSLKDIKVVFENGDKETYHVDFDDYYGNVASYMITELNIGYNYNKFIINTHLPIIDQLEKGVKTYTYDNDIEPLTSIEDSRLYRENFENKTVNRTREFVIKTLVNLGYTPTFENDVLNEKIKQELLYTDKFKQMLFAYNYFTKWYDFDMQGLNVADTLMFESNQMFDERLTFDHLATKLVQGENSKPKNTAAFYKGQIAYYTQISNIGLYFDHLVTELTTYDDGNDWFAETFKGGIYDTVDIGKPGVNYTIWDHVKHDEIVQRDFLPLLNVPEDSTFLITSPTQVFSGSLRTYVKDPKDPQQIKELRENRIKEFERQVKQFYIFGYNYWGADVLNAHCDTQYDRRTTFTGKGEQTVYNNPYSTEEPYHKYFIESIERWAGTSGAAYANGMEVYWNTIPMLENFRVGTHETLHNQDSKIFMGGYGRRGGAEDYAAGFIQQYYVDGWVSPNIFDEGPVKDNDTQNLYRSSVENDAKLARFYKNYFRANDFLDYLEAQAFFQLDNKEKAQVASRVYYPKVSQEEQEKGDDVVEYIPLTEQEAETMNLNDMKALWDNRIMLRPGNTAAETHSPGADTDSIYNIHWYQPHADDDRPDGASFKYNAWQMAGEKGYYEGLCAYYSLSYIGIKQKDPNLKTTDSVAIKYITGKDSFKEYKLGRFDELSQYVNNKEGVMINPQNVIEEYEKALKEDAKNKDRNLTQSKAVKKKWFQYLRNATEDFKKDPLTGLEGKLEDNSSEVDSKILEAMFRTESTRDRKNNTTNTNSTKNTTNTNTSNNTVTSQGFNTSNTSNTTNTANTPNSTESNNSNTEEESIKNTVTN